MSTWTYEDERELRRRWSDGEPLVRIALAVGRSRDTVRRKISSMGLRGAERPPIAPQKPWTEREVMALRKLWPDSVLGIKAIALKLKRTPAAVKAKAEQLNLPSRVPPSHSGWKPAFEPITAVDDSAFVAKLNALGGFKSFGEVYRTGGPGPSSISYSRDWKLLPVVTDRRAA